MHTCVSFATLCNNKNANLDCDFWAVEEPRWLGITQNIVAKVAASMCSWKVTRNSSSAVQSPCYRLLTCGHILTQNHTSPSWIREAHTSLINRPTLVNADVKILTQNTTKHSFPCCGGNSCPLVNDCDSLAGFSDFYLPSRIWGSRWVFLELSGTYLVWGKLEWLGYNLAEVAWWSTQSFGHNTKRDKHTDSHVAIANDSGDKDRWPAVDA